MSELSGLPLELYGHVFSFVSRKNDLRSLCTSSRAFYEEAVPYLYRDVHFKGSLPSSSWTEGFGEWMPLDALAPFAIFCTTVNASTPLAGYVVAFRLEYGGHHELVAGRTIDEWLSSTLPGLVNLRDLSLLCDTSSPPSFLGKCQFQLTRFHSTFFDGPYLHQFLASQRDLRHWAQYPRQYSRLDVPDDVLPDLTILEVSAPYLVYLRAPRPVRRAKITFGLFGSKADVEVEGIDALQTYRDTLQVLWLDKFSPLHGSSPLMAKRSAMQVPNVSVLIMSANIELARPLLWYSELKEALSGFNCLKTFTVDPGVYSESGVWWLLSQQKEDEDIAAELFELLPSLSMIGLPRHEVKREYKIVTYGRSPHSGVMEDAGTDFDIDSAWLTL